MIYLKPNVSRGGSERDVKEEAARNRDVALQVLGRIEHSTLRTVTSSTCIYYSPDPRVAVGMCVLVCLWASLPLLFS